MELMSVTLDVSRFNGWLNTSVSCQVIHTGTGDMRGVRIHGGVLRESIWCKQRAEDPAVDACTANIETMSVTLEVSSKLSGLLNAFARCAREVTSTGTTHPGVRS